MEHLARVRLRMDSRGHLAPSGRRGGVRSLAPDKRETPICLVQVTGQAPSGRTSGRRRSTPRSASKPRRCATLSLHDARTHPVDLTRHRDPHHRAPAPRRAPPLRRSRTLDGAALRSARHRPWRKVPSPRRREHGRGHGRRHRPLARGIGPRARGGAGCARGEAGGEGVGRSPRAARGCACVARRESRQTPAPAHPTPRVQAPATVAKARDGRGLTPCRARLVRHRRGLEPVRYLTDPGGSLSARRRRAPCAAVAVALRRAPTRPRSARSWRPRPFARPARPRAP